jgi:hypothetical protein
LKRKIKVVAQQCGCCHDVSVGTIHVGLITLQTGTKFWMAYSSLYYGGPPFKLLSEEQAIKFLANFCRREK